ncbi:MULTISPECIES: DUF1203 domain-containing protein [unclassified Azospirillum]|uniref:DUF1203 domain-containing protein n=1 Tax=unclassified Azospirillum TaxID=2630922 RepID=UPI000B74D5D3|nr:MULTISPECIES: DUF1203 domain-containing protein [unclassified Azospirillum]SNR88025.1 Protein of unknown function [Azospirillum sp. RU38E]SNS04200.1 Protein of unknown function [Azospirillum sp. RU37A]
MTYRVSGLSSDLFTPLFSLDDATLAAQGIRRVVTPSEGLIPCRITLADAPAGTTVLLLSFRHQPANSPYRAEGPIFVTQGPAPTCVVDDELPPMMAKRLLSVRAYNSDDLIVKADVVDGKEADGLLRHYLAQSDIAYLHVHFAKHGCYAGRVDRT